MEQIKVFVTISVPDNYVDTDEKYIATYKHIKDAIYELADGVRGVVEDLEVK